MSSRLKERDPVPQKILRSVHSQLDSLELSVESIEGQTLKTLEASLNKVDAYLKHPPSLKLLRVRHTRLRGYCFSYAGLTLSFDAIIRPILLNRRSLIMGRLEALKLDDGITSLSESLKEGNDEVSQLRLTNKLRGMRASSHTLEGQLIQASKEKEQLRLQIEKERLNLLEGKFKILLSLLQKDAAATLVGLFFLVIAAFVWLVAMFIPADAPPVLREGLFLVFGYFFGQAATQSSSTE